MGRPPETEVRQGTAVAIATGGRCRRAPMRS